MNRKLSACVPCSQIPDLVLTTLAEPREFIFGVISPNTLKTSPWSVLYINPDSSVTSYIF